MSTEFSRQHSRFARRARNLGISAVAAAAIGGYTLYQRSSVSADAIAQLPTISGNVTAQVTQQSTGLYQDGEFTGDSVRADHWGNVQVTVVIENGAIANFKINDYPHSRSTSQRISQIAIPYLMQEAIQAQSADIDLVSGATPTSQAFIRSLQSALDDASSGVTATATPGSTGASL